MPFVRFPESLFDSLAPVSRSGSRKVCMGGGLLEDLLPYVTGLRRGLKSCAAMVGCEHRPERHPTQRDLICARIARKLF